MCLTLNLCLTLSFKTKLNVGGVMAMVKGGMKQKSGLSTDFHSVHRLEKKIHEDVNSGTCLGCWPASVNWKRTSMERGTDVDAFVRLRVTVPDHDAMMYFALLYHQTRHF